MHTTVAKAQRVFLDPDTVYITTGVGTEFDLELKVDEDVASLKTFVFHVRFDPARMDTVLVDEGPLLPSAGATTVFHSYIVGDSVLQIEGLILGAGIDVSGPGVLAYLRVRALDTGVLDMGVIGHQLRDVANTLYPSDSGGAVALVNVPPSPFDLLSPGGGELISGFPGDFFDLVWQATASTYPGETVTYTLDYGTSPVFAPTQTTTLTGLTDTTHTLYVDDLENGTYYWRVTAVGSLHGFTMLSNPGMGDFDFQYGLVEPEAFDLLAPDHGVLIDIVDRDSMFFDWEDAVSIIPGDTLEYHMYMGPSSTDTLSAVIKAVTEIDSDVAVPIDSTSVPLGEMQYWRVNAVNTYDLNRWSTSTRSLMFYKLCDLDNSGGRDVGDLTLMISFLFITFDPPDPLIAANCDCEGQVDVGDLTMLIDHLFVTFAPIEPCR